MLQVKNTKLDTANGAELYDCIVKTSATNCTAVNTIAPTFITCVTEYCVSGDNSATGTGDQTNKTPTYDASYNIAQSWANTNLVGQGWNGSDIAYTFYYDDSSGSVNVNITNAVTGASLVNTSFVIDKSVLSSITAVASVITQLYNALLSVVSAGGTLSVSVIPSKNTTHNISAISAAVETVLIDKGVVSNGIANPQVTTDIAIIKELLSSVSAGDSTASTINISKNLTSAISANESIASAISKGLEYSVQVSGVANADAISVTINKLVDQLIVSGAGDVLTTIAGKIVSLVTGAGSCQTTVAVLKEIFSTISAASNVLTVFSKGVGVGSALSSGAINTLALNVDKFVSSSENTSHFLAIDIKKGIYEVLTLSNEGSLTSSSTLKSSLVPSSISASALDSLSILIDKELNLIVSDASNVTTVHLGNFEDTNVIVFGMTATAEASQIYGDVYLKDTTIEVIINART